MDTSMLRLGLALDDQEVAPCGLNLDLQQGFQHASLWFRSRQDGHQINLSAQPLLNAFRYGAPPHGGIAPGVDRIVMLLAGEDNLREVVMFPKDQQARDLMMNAPSSADMKQLRELHIRTVIPEEKKD